MNAPVPTTPTFYNPPSPSSTQEAVGSMGHHIVTVNPDLDFHKKFGLPVISPFIDPTKLPQTLPQTLPPLLLTGLSPSLPQPPK